jgi:hypothetical protein
MQIKELSNVKEEVYGTLDSFVAWELEFPLIVVKKALKTLEDESEWNRIIQVLDRNTECSCQTFFLLVLIATVNLHRFLAKKIIYTGNINIIGISILGMTIQQLF